MFVVDISQRRMPYMGVVIALPQSIVALVNWSKMWARKSLVDLADLAQLIACA